ncbi:MAG: nucleoside phosphorylase [Bacteroidota bacterium]
MLASELILNQDGSVYHLGLKNGEVSPHIITVGDPARVKRIGQHLHSIEFERQKREFLTLTGLYKDLRLTVISTGIGTDNIDIVFNELDAVLNIDLQERRILDTLTSAKMLRLGTTGSLRESLAVDQFVSSRFAIGMEGLMEYYQRELSPKEKSLQSRFQQFAEQDDALPNGWYVASSSERFADLIMETDIHQGITVTAKGFYGPQGRSLGRVKLTYPTLIDDLSNFLFDGYPVTNLEMETAGILGLGHALGHQTASLSVALANRVSGEFSANPAQAVDHLIEEGLELMYQWSR